MHRVSQVIVAKSLCKGGFNCVVRLVIKTRAKPISVSCSHAFSRAERQLYVHAWSSDWFVVSFEGCQAAVVSSQHATEISLKQLVMTASYLETRESQDQFCNSPPKLTYPPKSLFP